MTQNAQPRTPTALAAAAARDAGWVWRSRRRGQEVAWTPWERADAVVLHGYRGRSSDLSAVAGAVRDAGATVGCLSYGSGEDPESAAALVLERLQGHPRPRILIGHSLGGVLAVLAAAQDPGTVRGVVTLASPLRGARLAGGRAAQLLRLDQLAPGGRLVQRVRAADLDRTPLVMIAGAHDGLVAPEEATLPLEGRRRSVLVPAGHFSVLFHPTALAQVRSSAALMLGSERPIPGAAR